MSMSAAKVAIVNSLDYGGAGIAAYRLYSGLRSIRIDSEMFVIAKTQQDDRVVKVSAVPMPWKRWKTELLTLYPNRSSEMELFTDTSCVAHISEIPDIDRFDVVHLHWVAGFLDYSEDIKVLAKKKIVWTLHDMNPFTGGCHYAGECIRYRQHCGACPQLGSCCETDLSADIWLTKKKLFNELDITVVTPSRWLADCAKNSALFRRFDIRVIPNGFPIRVFRPYPRMDVRKELNFPVSSKIILFGAAYDTKRKGFHYFVDACQRLALKNKQPLVLAVFGNLPKMNDIPSSLNIRNFGSVMDESQLAKIYSAADVFVIPSLEDNLPNAAIEALCCGTPVVGFATGGIAEIVDHQKNGYLAPCGDSCELSEGINALLCLPESRYALMRLSAREKAVAYYSLQNQAQAYEELYQKLLD